MLTIDASVWVAAFDPRDAFHGASARFLTAVATRGVPLTGPAFVLVETSCALSRLSRSAAVGTAVLNRLAGNPLLTLEPVTASLLSQAAQLGSAQFLRGADSLYAATAQISASPLISWDEDLIQRAGALTPSDWLAANP